MMEPVAGMTESEIAEASRISKLIAAYIEQKLDRAGHEELDAWVNADSRNLLLFEELTDTRNREKAMQWFSDIDERSALAATKEKIVFEKKAKSGSRIWQFAIAAAILVAIALAAERLYVKLHPDSAVPPAIATTISPGGNKALLIVGNGDTIDLTGRENGIVTSLLGAVVNKKQEGLLEYGASDRIDSLITMNTLSTPNGGEYVVVLSDGTKARLNAASSIRYPVSFKGAQNRSVLVTGEVFFEVAKDSSHPFIVSIGDNQEVKVLGTHFDVMNYPDEEGIKITLEEASVLVNGDVRLQPGEQYSGGFRAGNGKVVKLEDMDEALAWTKGNFSFNNTPIQTIMRQLARWYDLQVNYKGTVSDMDFTATLSRKDSIETVLRQLEKTGAVRLSITGRQVTVTR